MDLAGFYEAKDLAHTLRGQNQCFIRHQPRHFLPASITMPNARGRAEQSIRTALEFLEGDYCATTRHHSPQASKILISAI